MSTSTEQQIAAALSAHTGGITMDTSTLEKRFAQVQERTQTDRRRRRTALTAGVALATAAAAAVAFALVSAVPWQDEAAPYADREVAELTEPYLVGDGRPGAGGPYSVAAAPVPFTVELPELGDVPGTWSYGVAETFTVGLEASPATGHANLVVAVPERVFDPSQPQPFGEQTPTVPAPTDADGWERWVQETGAARVTAREELEVGGVPATRLTIEVSDDVQGGGFPCAPGESCVAVSPDGPSFVGSAREGAFVSELTVLDVDGRTVLASAIGAEDTADQWLPLMRSVVDSLRFS